MPLNDKNVPFVTAAGCCLAAASGFTFGQRHYFAGTIGSQDVVANGLWVFLIGVLVGGLAKDLLGARIAICISAVSFGIGAIGSLQASSILWLALAGGVALAVCNGMFESPSRDAAGRWLNFTHAFYRCTSLIVVAFWVPVEVVKWFGLLGAGLALALYRTPQESLPEQSTVVMRRGGLLLVALLTLNFLAGAFELWSERVYVDRLLDTIENVGLLLAGAMFLGRLAASTAWFSGNRQLFICSLMASIATLLFPLTHGTWQLGLAVIGAFFSASIFPAVLGMVSAFSQRWRGLACSFGQISCMLAALLTTRASGLAFVPGVSLVLISAWLLWLSGNQGRR